MDRFNELTKGYNNVSNILDPKRLPELQSLAALADMSTEDFANYQVKRLTINKAIMEQPVEVVIDGRSVELTHPNSGNPLLYSDFLVDRSGPKFLGALQSGTGVETLIPKASDERVEQTKNAAVERYEKLRAKDPAKYAELSPEQIEIATSVFERPHTAQRNLSDFDLVAREVDTFGVALSNAIRDESGLEVSESMGREIGGACWEFGGKIDTGTIKNLQEKDLSYKDYAKAELPKPSDSNFYHPLIESNGVKAFGVAGLPNLIEDREGAAIVDDYYGLGVPFMGTEVRECQVDGLTLGDKTFNRGDLVETSRLYKELAGEYNEALGAKKIAKSGLKSAEKSGEGIDEAKAALDLAEENLLKAERGLRSGPVGDFFANDKQFEDFVEHQGRFELGDVICDATSHYSAGLSHDNNISNARGAMEDLVGKEHFKRILDSKSGSYRERMSGALGEAEEASARKAAIFDALPGATEAEKAKATNHLESIQKVRGDYQKQEKFLETSLMFEQVAKKEAQSQLFWSDMVEAIKKNDKAAQNKHAGKLIGNISDVSQFMRGVQGMGEAERNGFVQMAQLSALVNMPRWGITAENNESVGQLPGLPDGEASAGIRPHGITKEVFKDSINNRSLGHLKPAKWNGDEVAEMRDQVIIDKVGLGGRAHMEWNNIDDHISEIRLLDFETGMQPVWNCVNQNKEFFEAVDHLKAIKERGVGDLSEARNKVNNHVESLLASEQFAELNKQVVENGVDADQFAASISGQIEQSVDFAILREEKLRKKQGVGVAKEVSAGDVGVAEEVSAGDVGVAEEISAGDVGVAEEVSAGDVGVGKPKVPSVGEMLGRPANAKVGGDLAQGVSEDELDPSQLSVKDKIKMFSRDSGESGESIKGGTSKGVS